MKNKQLILLLISVFIYVSYIPSYDEKIDSLIKEIMYLKMKIYKEISIERKKNLILKELENSLKIAEKNEKFVFKDLNDSEIQSKIQNYLKNLASSLDANFLGASWEESLEYEEFGYKELPMAVSIKGTPPIMGKIFIDMFKFNKIIQIKNLEIGKSRPYNLLFAFKISSYKIQQKNETQK